ncbi:EAL domain-containing protein [Myxococcota bacterium]|nr:EAL domain-containing protein [Myxococcota bacterium]
MLLVDDEPLLLKALQRTLYDPRLEVAVASQWDVALGMLEERPVDVIVCDDRMPGMRGSELLATVRERFPRTVRVMLTGDGTQDSAMRAINDAGVFRFLRKPCTPDELRRCIHDAMGTLLAEGAESEKLDEALEQLWMAAHPIVDVASGTPYAYELLVRCRAAGLERPDLLFALAERVERISDLEARILRHAGDVVRDLPAGADLYVNLHPATLLTPELLDPLAPHAARVVLEITERAALEKASLDNLAALRRAGFRAAIDDLGAGYSGLNHVAELRPEVVKLDRTLVQGVVTSATHSSLVSAMLGACRELGIVVVSEGVETVQMRDKLADLGCHHQQGFLFARPGPPFPTVTNARR